MFFVQLAAIAALASSADARGLLASAHARQTVAASFAFDGITPRPTPGPRVPAELVRRQTTSEVETVLVAPDNICGYISGRPGASFFCPASMTCIFFTASATIPGAVACCNPDSCNLRVTCLDFDQVSSSSACDNGCLVDPFTLKCTNSALRFCNTISFSSDIIDYWCNDVSISTTQAASTNFDGASTPRIFTPLALSDDETTAGLRSLTASQPSSPAQTGDPDDDDDQNGGGGGGGGGSGGKKKKSNTGAIAGGVVGGIALVGALASGVLFLLKKKKKQDGKSETTSSTFVGTPQPMHQQPPTPMQGGYVAPNGHQSYYDPNFNQQQPYGYPPKQDMGLVPGYPPGAAPDRTDSTSPMSDARISQQPVSSPTISHYSYQQGQQFQPPQQQPPPQQFQPQQPTIHEAGGAAVDHHRGQMHELA